ncbi:hypothetical protein PENTCL1PPCAC_29867, partial [Pristionchus entomophagus]
RFASTHSDDELLHAVTVKVASIVNEAAPEIFWSDGESNITLETADDILTVIDYAKATRMNPSKTPCVRLMVSEKHA